MNATQSPPDERLDLYDASVPWSVRERHLRRYVDAVCWVMKYRGGIGPTTWLDVGAGTGYGLRIIGSLLPRFDDLLGVDNWWHADVLCADVRTMSFDLSHHSWTVISAMEVLEHFPSGDWSATLAEIRRCLAVYGCFVGTCPIGHDGPNPLNPHHRFEPTKVTLEVELSRHFRVERLEFSAATLTTGQHQETAMFLCVPK